MGFSVVHLYVCAVIHGCGLQSVTSHIEASQYRDFSLFFESISIGLKNISS